jgi:hypothetical protein
MGWFALVCVVAFHDQKAVFHKQLNAGIDPGSLMAGVLPFLRQFNDCLWGCFRPEAVISSIKNI